MYEGRNNLRFDDSDTIIDIHSNTLFTAQINI